MEFIPDIKDLERYKDSRMWRKYRREWFKNPMTRKTCFVCESPTVMLHHITYENWGQGREPAEDIVPLCPRHHKSVHRMVDDQGVPLREAHLRHPKEWSSGRISTGRPSLPGSRVSVSHRNKVTVKVDAEEAKRRIAQAKSKSRIHRESP